MNWFNQWFGTDYLELYQHRSLEQASEEVAFVLAQAERFLGRSTGSLRVLDAASGTGRHSIALEKHCRSVVGLDLSPTLVGEAKRRFPELPFVRGDIRTLPFLDHTFDLLCTFFTSFGYFESDQEHQDLLAEYYRVIEPGGLFMLDFLNPDEVRAKLPAESVDENNEKRVVQRRFISSDGTRVEKEIEITAKENSETKTYRESVRLFSQTELARMFSAVGFSLLKIYGDFTGSQNSSASPRTIYFLSKPKA